MEKRWDESPDDLLNVENDNLEEIEKNKTVEAEAISVDKGSS